MLPITKLSCPFVAFVPINWVDEFCSPTWGVIDHSDDLKRAIPAGFTLSTDKSAPSAPKAPATLLNLAVPPKSRKL